jgi:uncharacterized membrane protein
MKIQREIFMIAIKKNELLKIIGTKDDNIQKMLENIVEKLNIQLQIPENEIVKQGSDEIDAMFFV